MPTKCQEIVLEWTEENPTHEDQEINVPCTGAETWALTQRSPRRQIWKQKPVLVTVGHTVAPVSNLRTWQKSPGRLTAECLWREPSAARCHAAGLRNMPAGWRQSGVIAPCCPACEIAMSNVREHVKGCHVTDVTNSWLLRRLLTACCNQPSRAWETWLITENILASMKSNTARDILTISSLHLCTAGFVLNLMRRSGVWRCYATVSSGQFNQTSCASTGGCLTLRMRKLFSDLAL